MAKLEVSRLPVVLDVESMRLVGIVSVRDLLQPSHRHMVEETMREKLR
jgi:predicted transcriptional regulator